MALRVTAANGYADMLLGEQTKRRAKALAPLAQKENPNHGQ